MVEKPRAPRWATAAVLASAVITAALIASKLWGSSPAPVTVALVVAYFAIAGWLYGRWWWPNQTRSCQLTFGVAAATAATSAIGTLWFYLSRWSPEAMALTLALVAVIPWWGLRRHEHHLAEPSATPPHPEPGPNLTLTQLLLAAAWAAFTAAFWYVSTTHGTAEPIRSPWAALPSTLWVAYVGATASLVCLAAVATRTWPVLLAAAHGVTSLSLAWTVYQLGYGFDPLIHQATERLLLSQGTFSPAPPYYLGQYVLVTLVTWLTGAPLEWVDRLLVPVGVGLLVPLATFLVLKRNFRTRTNISLLVAVAVLSFPLGQFIATTPYGLAVLFAILTVAAACFYLEQQLPAAPVLLLALASLAAHPLAGVPTVAFTLMLLSWRRFERRRSTLSAVAFFAMLALTPLALPASFFANSLRGGEAAVSVGRLDLGAALRTLGSPLTPASVGYAEPRDFAYLVGANLPLIVIILTGLGLLFVLRRSRWRRFTIFPLSAAATAVGAIVVAGTLTFSFLIDYERSDFPSRTFALAGLFAMPLALIAGYRIVRKLLRAGAAARLAVVVGLTALVTVGHFLTYPSFDRYRKDRGYNTSWVDFEVVRQIEADAEGRPYVVLANQAVAAAAVTTFGFGRTYRSHYFYPLPTGGPLYERYLGMVYGTPNLGTVSEARELTGVHLVYFVVNDYWDGSDRLRLEAAATTPHVIEVAGGRSAIYRYN